MELNKELKISIGHITEKNVELMRTLNLHTFPVQYNPTFYKTLRSYEKYIRLGINSTMIFNLI